MFYKGYHLFPYKKRIHLINEIIQLIDDGWYYFGKWNEMLIPNTYYNLNQFSYEHRNLIFGYDLTTRVFFTQGYLADWQWYKYEVSFYDFYRSLINQDGNIEFEVYKLNEEYKFHFSVENLVKEISQYIWCEHNERYKG